MECKVRNAKMPDEQLFSYNNRMLKVPGKGGAISKRASEEKESQNILEEALQLL